MATLADVSAKLDASNDQAEAQTKSIDQLNTNFSLFLRELGEDDSAEREEKREASVRGGAAPASAPAGGGSLFGGKSLLGFASGIGMGMLKRGVPGLIATMFADEIADYIYNETGNAELSDAIGRGITFGGIGLIFGKRFAVLGTAIGALLTEENRGKLTKLGEQFKIFAKDFDFFGMKLPDLTKIFTRISKSFGNSIDLFRGLLGDEQAMAKVGADPMKAAKDLGITIATLFGLFAPGAAISLALKALMAPFKITMKALKGTAAAALGTATTAAGVSTVVAQNAKPNRNFTRNAKGEMTNLKGKKLTGSALSTAERYEKMDLDSKLDSDMKTKFPKLKTFMKFLKAGGPISALIGAADVAMILGSDGPIDSKIGELGGALGSAIGGLSGFAGGAALGGILTGPLAPFGALGGGILGAVLGSFGGDAIGMALAQYLFDKKVTAFGFPFEFLNDAINNRVSSTPSGTAIQSGGGAGEFNVSSTPQNTRASNPPSAMSIANAYNQANSGGGAGASYVDASNNVSNYTDASTNQGITMPFSGSTDPYANMYLGG